MPIYKGPWSDLSPDHDRGAGGLAPAAGPPHDGGMEARVAKLEASMEHVQQDISELRSDVREIRGDIKGIRTTDFRLLFGAIIAVAVGLAAIMAHGFRWL